MHSFDAEMNQRLDAIREQCLYRELRRVDSAQSPRIEIGGRTFLNFSSNDYLGLANEPLIKEAAVRAIERFGTGSGASRLICGSLAPHHELEEALAAFKGTEAALSYSSGYAAALGTICALVNKEDVIVLDKLVHACIVDAARLSGAGLRIFRHNDLSNLEDVLKWATANSSITHHAPRVLIVTESVFSMDGDHAPLREIVELKEKYGAWMMVDEAHATGLYGKNSRGLAEALGVSDRIEIQMATLGKALGSSGGAICGSRALIDLLVNRARTLIFSTAPVPAAAAAATAAIRFVQSQAGDKRRRILWERVRQSRTGIVPVSNLPVPSAIPRENGDRLDACPTSAIIPIMIGSETKAAELAGALRQRGIFVPAIRYPTVARGKARLRVTITAAHSTEDIACLVRAFEQTSNRKS